MVILSSLRKVGVLFRSSQRVSRTPIGSGRISAFVWAHVCVRAGARVSAVRRVLDQAPCVLEPGRMCSRISDCVCLRTDGHLSLNKRVCASQKNYSQTSRHFQTKLCSEATRQHGVDTTHVCADRALASRRTPSTSGRTGRWRPGRQGASVEADTVDVEEERAPACVMIVAPPCGRQWRRATPGVSRPGAGCVPTGRRVCPDRAQGVSRQGAGSRRSHAHPRTTPRLSVFDRAQVPEGPGASPYTTRRGFWKDRAPIRFQRGAHACPNNTNSPSTGAPGSSPSIWSMGPHPLNSYGNRQALDRQIVNRC